MVIASFELTTAGPHLNNAEKYQPLKLWEIAS